MKRKIIECTNPMTQIAKIGARIGRLSESEALEKNPMPAKAVMRAKSAARSTASSAVRELVLDRVCVSPEREDETVKLGTSVADGDAPTVALAVPSSESDNVEDIVTVAVSVSSAVMLELLDMESVAIAVGDTVAVCDRGNVCDGVGSFV